MSINATNKNTFAPTKLKKKYIEIVIVGTDRINIDARKENKRTTERNFASSFFEHKNTTKPIKNNRLEIKKSTPIYS